MQRPDVETRWAGPATLILAAGVLAALCAYAWLGTSTRYMTDDYCTAATLRERGFLGAMRVHRETWSGRFSFYGVKAALESLGPWTAPIVPGLVTWSLAGAAAWAARRLLAATGPLAILAGAVVAYASLDASPSRDSRFGPLLWETGAVTYMLAAVLIALWTGLLRSRASARWTAAASATLMFMAGGLSETSVAAQGALTAGVLLLGLQQRDRPTVRTAASGLGGTLLALLVMATAPGNAIRMADLPPRLSLVDAALRTVGMANRYLGAQLFVEGASLLVVMVTGVVVGASCRVRGRLATSCAAIAAASYVATFAPSAWILPGGAPARALYVATFFAVIAVFATATAIGSRMSHLTGAGATATAALLLVTVIPLLSIAGVARLLPEARLEAAHADAVARLLEERRGGAVILWSRWAVASRFAREDASHWTNRCVSRFYGLKSLEVVRK